MCNCGNNGCGGCGGVSLPAGPAGPNGLNAFTFTTASFVQPTLATAAIVVPVSGLGQYTGLWATVGQWIFIEGAGTFVVTARTPTSITIDVPNADIAALNAAIAAFGSTVTAGKAVSPSGIQGVQGIPGTNGLPGADGSNVISYKVLQPIITPTAGSFQNMLTTAVTIPANTWEVNGDTLNLDLIVMGNGTSASLTTSLLQYRYEVRINGTSVYTILPGSFTTSQIGKNGVRVVLNLVASFSGSTMTLLKFNDKQVYGAGGQPSAAGFTNNTAFTFVESSTLPFGFSNTAFGPTVLGISVNPTISNTLTIAGTYDIIGGGGGASGQMVAPYLKVISQKV